MNELKLTAFDKILAENKALKKELKNYKKAYDLLMEYFDSISDEEQPIVDRKLKKLGL